MCQPDKHVIDDHARLEAAAEIALLRAALRQIIDRTEYRMSSKATDDVVEIAKTALNIHERES